MKPRPRPGYLFAAQECPNSPHPAPMEGTCGLCGTNVSAYQWGYRHAPRIILAVVLGLILVGVGISVLVGCAPATTTAEDRYLNAVYAEAKAQGASWTLDAQRAALDLGEAVCRDLASGLTLDAISAGSHQEDPAADAVIQAAVQAAPEHLCPEAQ